MFTDIYYKIDSKIVKKGFWDLDINEKRNLVNEEVKNYLIEKLDSTNAFYSKKADIPHLLGTLDLNMLEKSKEERNNAFSDIVNYYLDILSSIQDYQIVWLTHEEGFEKPVLNSENGIYTRLDTNVNSSIKDIFKYIYIIFNQEYFTKKYTLEK